MVLRKEQWNHSGPRVKLDTALFRAPSQCCELFSVLEVFDVELF